MPTLITSRSANGRCGGRSRGIEEYVCVSPVTQGRINEEVNNRPHLHPHHSFPSFGGVKEVVPPEINIGSLCTHPHVISRLYEHAGEILTRMRFQSPQLLFSWVNCPFKDRFINCLLSVSAPLLLSYPEGRDPRQAQREMDGVHEH